LCRLLSETALPGGARLSIDTANCFSSCVGSGNAGGDATQALKCTGHGISIFTGKTASPGFLWIDNDGIRTKPANELWGKAAFKTVRIFRKRMAGNARVACIGPAGENLVRGASVMVN